MSYSKQNKLKIRIILIQNLITSVDLKLLDGASLNTNQKQVALTIAKNLKWESMKAVLKQIFIGTPWSSEGIYSSRVI